MASVAEKSALADLFEARFLNFEKSLNGESQRQWHEVRKKNIRQLVKTGFPSVKSEEYKYTNLVKPLQKFIDGGVNELVYSVEEIDAFIKKDVEANVLVFVNNVFSPKNSNIISPSEEIVIKPLSQAFLENGADLRGFGHEVIPNDPFSMLNRSFAHEGCFIKVPKNITVSVPVILYFISGKDDQLLFTQPHNFFLVEENAEVSVIESFKSSNTNSSFTNSFTRIEVKQDARVKHAKLEIDLGNDYHVGTTEVVQEKASVFTNTTITFGGKMVRNNLNISIEGENAEANMYGLFVLNEDQHADNHSTVDHRVPNAISNELYKGIMDDQSKGVFNGKIYVRQDAQKTNAFQQNNNILLSDEANIYTKPQLEIWADDVKCSHGATTGKLDEHQLFYLMTRGIDEKSAKAILLQAFASEVIEKIGISELEGFLEVKLRERLTNYF